MRGSVLRTFFQQAWWIAIVGMLFSCTLERKQANALNLTKNALWDEPVMQEADKDSFSLLLAKECDSRLLDFVNSVNYGKATLKEIQQVHDSLSRSKSPYAGYLRVLTLNQILINTPTEQFSKEFVLRCLHEGYSIAQGKMPVPQSLFFNFWDNCMVGISNVNAYDEVYQESQKLLEVCENQNLPLGVMYSYRALAGNLQDHFDYSTALLVYESAEKAAREYVPELFSKDGTPIASKIKDYKHSDFWLNYVDMISNEVYCCINNQDFDWIKKNEKLLNEIIADTKDSNVIQICMLFNMAQYYDAAGKDSLFEQNIAQAAPYKPETEEGQLTFADMMYNYNYCQTMALHEMKQNHLQKALDYMDQIQTDNLMLQSDRIYADIYQAMGRYKEATEHLLKIANHNREDLDGRNRQTLTSMSQNIENKKRDIQRLVDEEKNHRMQLFATYIILAIGIVFTIALVLFLHHQVKLNQKLAAALDKAEVANRAKNVFLKNMTHEINTPVNQIFGFAQIMADRSFPLDEESMRQMSESICESSNHLMKLTTNIIQVADDVSKLDGLETSESVLKS